MDDTNLIQVKATLAALKYMEQSADRLSLDNFVYEALHTAISVEALLPSLADGELKSDLTQSAKYLRFMAAKSELFSLGDFLQQPHGGFEVDISARLIASSSSLSEAEHH